MPAQSLAGHHPTACQALCQVLARATLPVGGGGVGREWLKTEERFFFFFFSVPDQTVGAGTRLLWSFGSPGSFLIPGRDIKGRGVCQGKSGERPGD